MILAFGAMGARALEAPVELAFQAPAEVQLFTRAALVDVRGSVKGGDCGAAVAAALADAAGAQGAVVRIVESRDDLTAIRTTPCRQRMAGDDVSNSTVELVVITLEPGFPPTVFPKVTTDRAVEIAEVVGELSGADLGAAEIASVDGSPWVRSAAVTHPDPVDSSVHQPGGRGAIAYERYVAQWVSRWVPVLSAIPEVKGAVLEVVVSSADAANSKKSRVTEIFRFAVPTKVAASYLKGGLTDDAFVEGIQIERAGDAKKRNFQPFALEFGESGTTLATQRLEDRGPIEVPDEDLEGVEDE